MKAAIGWSLVLGAILLGVRTLDYFMLMRPIRIEKLLLFEFLAFVVLCVGVALLMSWQHQKQRSEEREDRRS